MAIAEGLMIRTIVLLGMFGLSSVVVAGGAERVTIDTGGLQGVTVGTVTAFKGIPFAQPPVGELRWRPPQPVKRWSGVRNATEYGADCMQEPFPGDAAPLGVQSAEDCLYANVWTPAKRGAGKLPVMVWIYGGGFVNGGSSPAVYDGSEFAKDGVVLVSFNYRLGYFGFFAHPALSAEQRGGLLGNYAIMDQVAALEWVKRNVAAFGGDPNNVTIFGESAGGMAVHILLTTPLASGLFQKAIVESGGGRPGVLGGRPVSGPGDSGEARGLVFAKKYGIEGQDAAALQKLRAVPAATIAKGFNMTTMRAPSYAGGPLLDGKLVVGAPSTIYEKGQGARVPLIIGATNNDLGFVQAKTLDELFTSFGPHADKARAIYGADPNADFRTVAGKVGGDQTMAEPVRHIARVRAAQGQKVWQFRFSYVAESLRKQWPGAPHATEIPYVFNTVAARYGKDLTPADAATGKAAHAYWVGFAKTGVPSAAGLPEWPAYDSKTDRIMDFTNDGPQVTADAWKARLDLAEAVSNAREQHGANP
jgi:para-nitrobenzyl esterase